MSTIIAWIVIGLVAGGVGGLALKARGFVVLGCVLAGFLGAALGGVIAGKLFGVDVLSQLTLLTLIESALGSIALVAIVRRLPEPEHLPEWRRRL